MKRRKAVKAITLLGLSTGFSGQIPAAENSSFIHRKIPKTGELIPVIGMGSWLTFDVLGNSGRMNNMKRVLSRFHQLGGRVVDSSPMYGSSEEVIGILSNELGITNDLWVSTKVWTNGKQSGLRQMADSNGYFSNRVKVHHVHNIRDFKTHYASLREAYDKGELKYIGVTHYLNHQHNALIDVLKNYKLDFVQFNYNIENPNADNRLIPTAADLGIATIVNQPFQTGRLFDMLGSAKLPAWADEMGIRNWASYMLKYIISNQSITCAIPATTQVAHVEQNMRAGTGYLPTTQERKKMRDYFLSIV